MLASVRPPGEASCSGGGKRLSPTSSGAGKRLSPTRRGHQEVVPMPHKVAAAIFYGVSSLVIMFVNKIVLTSKGFPSFNCLAASQFAVTFVILHTLKKTGKVNIADPSWEIMRIMAPLVIISLINVLMGLGGTQRVSLPMFTVLRRFSILFTMLLEKQLLKASFSRTIEFSVFLMLLGTLVAAMYDLSFDMQGYAMILICDVTTALSGVITKMILANSGLNKMSVLYHSSWISSLLMLGVLGLRPQEMEKVRSFPHWDKPDFVFAFVLASLMGSILNYSTFLCTALNSALTTTVVGCLKNVLTTYLGMIFLPDYIFSWSNFLGLNISIGGSLLYSWAEFVNKERYKKGGLAADQRKDSLEDGSVGRAVAAAAGNEEEDSVRLLEAQEGMNMPAVEPSRRYSRSRAEDEF